MHMHGMMGYNSLYNNMVPPGRLVIGSNYHLFKDGIDPEWEHKDNHQVCFIAVHQ